MRAFRIHQYGFMLFGMVVGTGGSLAQVTLDGTLGPAGPLAGPHYAIPAELGQQRGGNLFHSFGRFSIHRGESATFSGPNSVNNIIGRVTGGQVSTIDGALRSTISGASLYLLNPAGVLFGPNATLDVPGAVHVSTAEYLRLGDGGRFDARTPGNSVLTVAPVEAFGFLGDAPGRIALQGSFLEVPAGETLSLIGGDIALTDATVYAPAGRLNVAAVGSAGEVLPTENDLALQAFERLGAIRIERTTAARSGDLDTSGSRSGVIFIRGKQLLAQGGQIWANTYGDQSGGGIDARVHDRFSLENGAQIMAATFGSGDAGSILLDVGRLNVSDGSQIITSALGSGRAGIIVIAAAEAINISGQDSEGYASGIRARSLGESAGRAGDILIATPALTINGGRIGSDSGGNNPAGDIELYVDQLNITNGGEISAGTLGRGQGGTIKIVAENAITISGYDAADYSSGISAITGAGGDAGHILISTPLLTMENSGRIRGYTAGTGGAAFIYLQVEQLNLSEGSAILTETFGLGQGGSILINASDAVTISGESAINARSLTESAGRAGDLSITTPLLVIDGGQIGSDTSGNNPAGNIDLYINQLNITNSGEVSSNTLRGSGQGGTITIVAARSVNLDGAFSGITAYSGEAKGHAGNILILTPQLTLSDGSWILNAAVASEGNAGDITLGVAQLSLSGGSQIISGTSGAGRGGTIVVIATEAVTVSGRDADGSVSTILVNSVGNATGKAGNIDIATPHLTLADGGGILATSSQTTGGNITINADHLKMFDSRISSTAFGDVPGSDGGNVTIHSTNIVALNGSTVTARAEEGQGGRILIEAQAFLHDAPTVDDVLSATGGRSGNDGTVELNAPTIDLSGSLVAAETHYLDATTQLSQRCGGEELSERSRFIVQGRGALPPAPGDPATAPLGQCGPGALALASPAAADAPPPPAARAPRVAEFGFNNR